MGSLVERFPELTATLDRWAADENFWIRRSAMLSLLVPLRRGDLTHFERFAGYADAMLAEREFFIRKAIGWILRETAKKQPDLVAHWLAPRVHRISGVTIREAVKWLPAPQREALLAAYGARGPTAKVIDRVINKLGQPVNAVAVPPAAGSPRSSPRSGRSTGSGPLAEGRAQRGNR